MVDKSKMTREELFFFELKEKGVDLLKEEKPEKVKKEVKEKKEAEKDK